MAEEERNTETASVARTHKNIVISNAFKYFISLAYVYSPDPKRGSIGLEPTFSYLSIIQFDRWLALPISAKYTYNEIMLGLKFIEEAKG